MPALALAMNPPAIHQPAPIGTTVVGLAALKPQDIQAICRELSLPLPTPDVPLSAILDVAGMTATDVYVRLERSTRMDAMIAAAALRTGVVKFPRDPRLAPAPHRLRWDLTEEARAGRPKPLSDSRLVADPGMPPVDHVIVAIGDCGSAPGSKRAVRFGLYRLGATVAETRNAGVKGSDIRRHISEGAITFGPKVAA